MKTSQQTNQKKKKCWYGDECWTWGCTFSHPRDDKKKDSKEDPAKNADGDKKKKGSKADPAKNAAGDKKKKGSKEDRAKNTEVCPFWWAHKQDPEKKPCRYAVDWTRDERGCQFRHATETARSRSRSR